jgi:hypothetical protein
VAIARDASLLIAVGGPLGGGGPGAAWAGYWRAPCTPCPAGKECSNTFLPVDCPAGSYCLQGDLPVLCSVGSYCPAGTGTVNPHCPLGMFCADTSNTTPCPLGRFGATQRLTAATQCTTCSAGRYPALTGQSVERIACPGCPIGRWSAALVTAQTDCTQCAAGKVGTLDASTSEATGCIAPCAATRTAPVGGELGTCAGSSSAYACWPTCPPTLALSGPSTCTGSTFTSATCTNCGVGKYYTQRLHESLVNTQDPVVVGAGYQGSVTTISRDGSVMVVSAWLDNSRTGSQCNTNSANWGLRAVQLHLPSCLVLLTAVSVVEQECPPTCVLRATVVHGCW